MLIHCLCDLRNPRSLPLGRTGPNPRQWPPGRAVGDAWREKIKRLGYTSVDPHTPWREIIKLSVASIFEVILRSFCYISSYSKQNTPNEMHAGNEYRGKWGPRRGAE